ncbi:MAG: histidine--tRNA ligase [Chromatiales bacterium]
MATPLRAIRGMNDVLPAETPLWQWCEGEVRAVLEAYGYREIRLPIVEATQLFERSIGDTTDIVEKEMYTFNDRNGESLSLRPEGTAGCVRAGLQHGLLHNQTLRLWYVGPMFRHERPQQGRYRQFHQIGVEAFGLPGPDIDAELILMTARLWRRLGLQELVLQINSLGSPYARAAFRDALVAYFAAHEDEIDADSQRRLRTNPLRILDSKEPSMQALIAAAPAFDTYIDHESAAHFDGLKQLLTDAGIAFTLNPRLVRGLDYYTRTVFEWVTTNLGAQGTVCAGGRYDGLVEQFGSRSTPAIGFAMGMERLIALLQQSGRALPLDGSPHVYLMPLEAACIAPVMQWAETLREAVPALRVLTHCGGGSVKSQMKRADQSGARWGILIGPDELEQGTVTLRPLRGDGEQRTLPRDAAVEWLKQRATTVS